VSVSDEALAGFERRVTQVRTVFDSAFDEIIRLNSLTAYESVELLRRRLAGVPDCFLLLCHCLAGGMPRDVIRTARTMLHIPSLTEDGEDLAEVTKKLVAGEVASLTRGFLRAAHEGLSVEPALAARSLAGDWPRIGVASLSAAITEVLGGARRDREPTQARVAFAAALYFYLTVLEIFTVLPESVNQWSRQVVRRQQADSRREDVRLSALLASEYALELARSLDVVEEVERIHGAGLGRDTGHLAGGPELEALGHAHRALSTHPAAAVEILNLLRGKLGLTTQNPRRAARR
jgi:hypothetical protein